MNSSGDLTSLTQADGTQVQFGYDSSHDLTSVTNGDGAQTTLTYNSSHQVLSVTQPTTGGTTATTRFAYPSSTETEEADPDTDQSEAVASAPHVTYTVGPTDALITKVVDQQGNTRSASYTSFDDVKTSVNGVGGTTTNTYGANGGESLTKTQSPAGAADSFAYGNSATTANPTANFQPSSSTDAQGNTTAYTYDGAGNLLQSADALPATAKVTYNSDDGTPATSTDPMNGSNATTYSYTDGDHELNKITPPSGNSLQPRTITYDGYGRVATTTDGAGNTTTYTYDTADRITEVTYTGGSSTLTVSYSYDDAGNLTSRTSVTPAQTTTTTWTYDGRNLVTSITPASGSAMSYGYDLDANLTTVTDPNGPGGTTSYSYDDRNLLTEMTDPTGVQWRFAYDADGRRTTTWFDTNSSESTWADKQVTSYDTSGRITRIQNTADSASPQTVFDTSYCYSEYVSGQSCSTSSSTSLVQYSTDNTTGTVSVNSYDKGNRLTQQTNDAYGDTATYSYDTDGNLTSSDDGVNSVSLSYNSANEISSSGYSYDGAGNMTSDPADPAVGSMSYNDADQLTQITAQSSSQGSDSFSYADRTQAEVLSDGSASGITYGLAGQDGQPWVQDYTAEAGQTPTAVYVMHDQRGTPLGEIYRNGLHNGDVAYVTDNLGSVLGTVDTTGSASGIGTYTPYGLNSNGNNTLTLPSFTGTLSDPEYVNPPNKVPAGTGFIHLGNRWYDPDISRFTQPDSQIQLDSPSNGNLYAYADDSPVNYIDPTGQSCASGLEAGAAAVFLGGTAELGIHATAIGLGEAAAEAGIETSLTVISGGIGALVAGVVVGSLLLAC